jgi:hypothetical protein
MAEPSSPSLLVTLVPVIVGGAIALAGSWLGPLFSDRRKEAAEKRQRRSAKFEEMVAAVYEYDHWIDKMRDEALGSTLPPLPISPMAKIEAIAAVYFPQKFTKQIADVNRATIGYTFWMAKARQRRLAGLSADQVTEGMTEAYQPYMRAKDALLDDLRKFAEKGFCPAGDDEAPTGVGGLSRPSWRGSLLLPQGEEAAASGDEAGQASTGDGSRNR